MIKLDFYWQNDPSWYTEEIMPDGEVKYHFHPDTPEDVIASFNHYMDQLKQVAIMESKQPGLHIV